MDAKDLVGWALEASLYFEPRRPGLTLAELAQLASHFGVTPSALETQLRGRATEAGRVAPFGIDPSFFASYEGDLRNVRAFDHVHASFQAVAEAAGQRPPMVDREALIASGVAAGLPPADVELAVAVYRAFESVPETQARWELRRIKPGSTVPSAQREGPARKVARRERYAELVDLVKGLIERRGADPATRGAASAPTAAAPATRTPAHVPPAARPPFDSLVDLESASGAGADDLVVFRGLLPSLGQGRLVAWWAQLSRDYRAAEAQGSALSACAFAATLAEAALMLVITRPRETRPAPNAKPNRWTLPEVAKAAASIGIDERLRGRLERLYKTRHRLNAAKVLEVTAPLSDVTPDDAREAGETLAATLRLVIASQSGRDS